MAGVTTMYRSVTAALLLFALSVQAEERTTVILPVMSRPAADLVPAIRPLLSQAASVGAYHDKLIVQGTPDEITTVRTVLADLDRPARRVMIEVRRSGQQTEAGTDLRYGVDTRHLRLGRTGRDEGVSLGAQHWQTRGSDDANYSVQAIDGSAAFIRTGQSVPVQPPQPLPYGYPPPYTDGYRDLSSGFYALPRLHGDQVTVEVYQQSEGVGGSGRFNHQQASSVLRGAVGEWLTLGSVDGRTGGSGGGIGLHATTRRTDDVQLELRVTPLD